MILTREQLHTKIGLNNYRSMQFYPGEISDFAGKQPETTLSTQGKAATEADMQKKFSVFAETYPGIYTVRARSGARTKQFNFDVFTVDLRPAVVDGSRYVDEDAIREDERNRILKEYEQTALLREVADLREQLENKKALYSTMAGVLKQFIPGATKKQAAAPVMQGTETEREQVNAAVKKLIAALGVTDFCAAAEIISTNTSYIAYIKQMIK